MTSTVARAGALMLAVVASACSTLPPLVRVRDPENVVFVDVTVVDGTGAPPLRHQDVVIAGDRIVWLGPTGGTHSARRIDGRGKTLLPGFVDAHTHIVATGGPPGGSGLAPRENLERFLAAGVTTVFDMSASTEEVISLVTEADAIDIASPRILHTNLLITGGGSHPIPIADTLLPMGSILASLMLPQVRGEQDISAALEIVEDGQPDFIKIVVDRMPRGTPILDRALLVLLVREARARGKPVFVHAGDVDDAIAAAEAGATALAHLPWRGRLTPEGALHLKKSGVAVVTTAAMWERTAALLAGRFDPTPEDEALIPAALVAAAQKTPTTDPRLQAIGAELQEHADDRAASLQALIEADVPLIVGTDAALPGTWPGSSYAHEVRTLLAAGVPANKLIPAMTSTPARLMSGRGADYGVVQTGKVADLVLVDGDPLQDPTALQRIELVLRAGRIVERLATASSGREVDRVEHDGLRRPDHQGAGR